MTKKANAEAAAAKAEKAAKEAEEKIRKANEPENKKQFWYFKEYIRRDSEIQNQLYQLNFRLRNDRGLANRIYDTALNDTYEYAVSTYTIIKPEHFEKMRVYLYNHIYEESKKAGL